MGPLAGIKVIEMAGIGPGPFCGMVLADMGAELVVIDRKPDTDERPALAAFSPGRGTIARRGKRSIGLDLRIDEGAAAALRLIERADALIEGFRPGVMERLGLGPEACLARNPKIVYGRVTGWGQTGPLARSAAHDVNFIALTGALHCGARRDGIPWAPPSLIGDMGGGGLLLAFGLVCGIFEARNSGKGQVIDAAMIDGAALFMHGIYTLHGAGFWRREPGTNIVDSGAPFYDVYQCRDGRWIAFGALEPQFYAQMLERLGLDGDPLFAGQFDASLWPERKRRVAEVVRLKTRDEWRGQLEGTDACFAPVLDMEEAPNHPHNTARQGFVEREGLMQPAPAPRFSRTPGEVRGAPPAPGEHTDQVLGDWGFGGKEIARLREAGAIA